MKKMFLRVALVVCSTTLFSFASVEKVNSSNSDETGRRFWGWERHCGNVFWNPEAGTCQQICQRVHYAFWIVDETEPPISSNVSCPPNPVEL